jgi:hypothetical protein
VSALKDFNIDLYEIPANVINDFKAEVGGLNIPEIKGIMKVHKITWCIDDKMNAKSLSCFVCVPSALCVHHNLGEVFPPSEDSRKTQKISAERKKKPKLSEDEIYGGSSEDEDFVDQEVTAENSSRYDGHG